MTGPSWDSTEGTRSEHRRARADPHHGRRRRTAVSEREVIGFLAAWKSAHPPRTRAELTEVVG
jgi:hypothetical protein